MVKQLSINDIIMAGVPTDEPVKIRASFKKTIQIRDYESEVIELSSELFVPSHTSSEEKAAYELIMTSQLRYLGYLQLLFRKRVSQPEFDAEITSITTGCTAMIQKLEQVSGKDLSFMFDGRALVENGNVQTQVQQETQMQG